MKIIWKQWFFRYLRKWKCGCECFLFLWMLFYCCMNRRVPFFSSTDDYRELWHSFLFISSFFPHYYYIFLRTETIRAFRVSLLKKHGLCKRYKVQEKRSVGKLWGILYFAAGNLLQTTMPFLSSRYVTFHRGVSGVVYVYYYFFFVLLRAFCSFSHIQIVFIERDTWRVGEGSDRYTMGTEKKRSKFKEFPCNLSSQTHDLVLKEADTFRLPTRLRGTGEHSAFFRLPIRGYPRLFFFFLYFPLPLLLLWL